MASGVILDSSEFIGQPVTILDIVEAQIALFSAAASAGAVHLDPPVAHVVVGCIPVTPEIEPHGACGGTNDRHGISGGTDVEFGVIRNRPDNGGVR